MESLKRLKKKEKIKDLKIYHEIKKCICTVSDEAFKALNHDQLDAIGEALCKNQSDDMIINELKRVDIPQIIINELLKLPNYPKFGHISVLVCKEFLPFLMEGLTYNKACEAAGYNFKAETNKKQMYLPAITSESNDIINPVVKRAVSQTIKVINAIIGEMNKSPVYINIELSRELSKDYDKRRKIEDQQKQNAAFNEKYLEQLREYVSNPSGFDLVKYKLWKEQDGRCMYSGESIQLDRLCEPGYVDVDHIVPYSICFDDRMVNKVLVLSKENRQKGNKLPLQYLQGSERENFIIRVTHSNIKFNKKQQLLKETITDEDEWKQRNLQDTQYISAFMNRYINDNLLFSDSGSDKKRRVTAVNGAITSYVRKRWGIQKFREDGDTHHAVDAVVIGCITQSMINRISRYSYYKETKDNGDYVIDTDTGEFITRFPTPWPHFLDELTIRLNEDEQRLHSMLTDVNYDSYLDVNIDKIKPMFVSRASNHKVTGAAHKETIRSGRLEQNDKSISKVSLTDLKLDKSGNIKGYYNPESDLLLYEALRKRLLEYEGDGKKAFSSYEFHKPKADGSQGPLVKKVKICETSTSFVHVHNGKGVADNDSMIRCDVFYVENDGYYFVPIYVSDTVKDQLPSIAPIAGVDKNGKKKRNKCVMKILYFPYTQMILFEYIQKRI